MPPANTSNEDAAAWERLVAAYGTPTRNRTTDEHIEQERERYDRARTLLKEGKRDEARSVFWWPPNLEIPKEHWSRVPVPYCGCGKRSPDGIYALCGYCGGTTSVTPSAISRI